MIASLMMYDRPELHAAHLRLWAAIRDHLDRVGIDSPAALSQTLDEFDVWTAPDLVLSQTCGMPYRLHLHGKVQLVGTPDYSLQDCPAGFYRSAIVVRVNDSRDVFADYKDARFAFNQTISQSGFAAAHTHAANQGFWFADRFESGSHVASARAVATGQADIAALDAVSWLNMQRFDAFARDLRVLEWTAPTPGLPLITGQGRDATSIFKAVQAAISELSKEDATDLRLSGLVRIDADTYLGVPNL